MKKKELLDNLTENLFGKADNLKSLEVMRNYLKQLDLEKLKHMLKEID